MRPLGSSERWNEVVTLDLGPGSRSRRARAVTTMASGLVGNKAFSFAATGSPPYLADVTAGAVVLELCQCSPRDAPLTCARRSRPRSHASCSDWRPADDESDVLWRMSDKTASANAGGRAASGEALKMQ